MIGKENKKNKKARIYIKTYGCSLNFSDSETMAGILEKKGHCVSFDEKDEKNAEVIIINSCTVKNSAEAKLFTKIRQIEERNKNSCGKNKSPQKIIIAGCVPQAEKNLAETKLKKYSIIGVGKINKINECVEGALKNKRIVLLDSENDDALINKRKPINKIIGIIPLSKGCLGNCAYCKTKQARGNLVSYPMKEIKLAVEEALKSGAKEIWLTSQDTAAYGQDIKQDIIILLKELIKIKGDFKIRLGMGNPNFFRKYAGKLAEIFKSEKMFKFFHIPIQSGSDKILSKMRRKYKIKDASEIVKKIRKEVRNITIATDLIVGFPGETDRDFRDSIDTIRKIKPDILNISRFWARPGTEAAKMDCKISGAESKKRGIILKKEFSRIASEENKKWLGWKGKVFIDEIGKFNDFKGRNDAYKQIIIKPLKTQKIKIGDIIDVKITETRTYDFIGKLI